MNKPGFTHEYPGSRLSTQGMGRPFPILDQSWRAHRALRYSVDPVLANRSLWLTGDYIILSQTYGKLF